MIDGEFQDRSCLSHWYPAIPDKVKTPRTEIVTTEIDFYELFCGETPEGYASFLRELRAAAKRIKYPVFLRTGHLSGKYFWKDTCFVQSEKKLPQCVHNIAELSANAGICGLATNVWAVREYLGSDESFSAFEGMPVRREFRVFVTDGKIQCVHPHCIQSAIEQYIRKPGVRNWRHRLKKISVLSDADKKEIHKLAKLATSELDGYWSVDFMWHEGEWWLIDMAGGDVSYHFPECRFSKRRG